MLKHVIWDFNGTLLADVALAVAVDNGILRQIGIPEMTLEDYRAHVSYPICDFYPKVGVDYSKVPFSTINGWFLEGFNAGVLEAGLVQGALETLQALKAAGLTQSILSSSYEPYLREQAQGLGITPYMALITGLLDDQAGTKEQRGVWQMAQLGLSPQAVAMVGDTVADALVAQHLGCRCVLVAGGHNSRTRLEACGVPVANAIGDVQKLLLG